MREVLDHGSMWWLKEAPEGEIRYVLIFRNSDGNIVRTETYTANVTENSVENMELLSSENVRKGDGST